MKKYDKNSPLISIHLPKCAGSSFLKVLKSWYGRKLYLHYYNEKKNKPPKKYNLYAGFFNRSLKKSLCIHGHFNNARNMGVQDYYPEIEQFITIIRNPFELHLSNYFYVRQLGKNKNAYREGKKHQIIEKGWDINGYLKYNKKSYLSQFFPSNITLDNYKEILEKNFIYIGVSENLQESVNILSNKLGFSEFSVPIENKSCWDEVIPETAIDEFIENNPLEMAIYNYALENFK